MGLLFVNFLNLCGDCSTNCPCCQVVCVNFLYFCILHKKGVLVLSFYNKYIRLCTEKGISPSAAAIEIGIRKSNVTYWKSNRSNPSDVTLQKIADYFGVTVEYLKGNTEKQETQDEEITQIVSPAIGGSSEFKQAVIKMICSRTDSELETLESALRSIYENL